MRIVLGAIITLSFFFNCKEHELRKDSTTTSKKDSLILYHIDSSKHGDKKFFVQNLANLMGMPEISKGTDDKYIRIWTYSNSERFIINIKMSKSIKNIEIIKWGSKIIGGKEYIIIYNKENVYPRQGWCSFVDTLYKFNIFDLKADIDYNKHNNLLTEMDPVQFEISQSNKYFFDEYLEPSFYKNVDSGSNDVYRFLNYLNDQVNIKIYTP